MMSSLYNKTSTKSYRRKLRSDSTPQERMLWAHIKNKQLGCKFRRQFSIGIYIIDFFCAERKLVIEIDGSQHFEKGVVVYDKKRSHFLKSQGCAIYNPPQKPDTMLR